MTPKCGRIDVEYANCSYHTHIGLGKWTHDPTLKNSHLPCTLTQRDPSLPTTAPSPLILPKIYTSKIACIYELKKNAKACSLPSVLASSSKHSTLPNLVESMIIPYLFLKSLPLSCQAYSPALPCTTTRHRMPVTEKTPTNSTDLRLTMQHKSGTA